MRVEGALGSTWEASPSAVWLSEITDHWPSVTGLPIAVLPRGLLWHVPRGFAGLGEQRIGDLLALWSKASQDGEPQAQLRGVLAKDAGQEIPSSLHPSQVVQVLVLPVWPHPEERGGLQRLRFKEL